MAACARSLRAAWILCLIWTVGAGAVGAQVLTTVEFSFSNPGARSLGFGGAFVALADDATAAFANPAGLIQLTEPEISIEGRSWRYETPYTAGGRAAGEPTGLGIDTLDRPLEAESTASLEGLSFFSLVYPLRDWSLAFFQHQLLNFEMTQEIQGLFGPGSGPADTYRGPIERAFFDFEITTRGVAAGYRAGDRLSLGLGVSHHDPATYFIGDEYLPEDDTVAGYFAPSSFRPERLSHSVRAEIPSSDWGLTVGWLWSMSREWKLGGVFREGPELELTGVVTAGPASRDLPPGRSFVLGSTSWHFPDVYGLGLSYRSPDGHWAAGFEWNRVEYASVIESLVPDLATPGDVLDDADELHLGGEYAFFAGRSIVAVRLGAWHDPDHRVRNESGGPFVRAELLRGEDELHLAGGLGVAFEKLQIDLGVDFSERRETLSLSAIYSL